MGSLLSAPSLSLVIPFPTSKLFPTIHPSPAYGPLNSELFTLPSFPRPALFPFHPYTPSISIYAISVVYSPMPPIIPLPPHHPILLPFDPLVGFAVCCIAVSPLPSLSLSIVRMAFLAFLIVFSLPRLWKISHNPFLYQSRLFRFLRNLLITYSHSLVFRLSHCLHLSATPCSLIANVFFSFCLTSFFYALAKL